MLKSYLTAIARTKPSAPAKHLVATYPNLGIFNTVLDYGCGRGMDARTYGWDMWDPHYYPNFEVRDDYYDAILCTYVLNTLTKDERVNVIKDIQTKLNRGGVAFLTVRRDIPEGFTFSSKGTYQRMVYLDLPIVGANSKYCIYILRKDSNFLYQDCRYSYQ